jgi:putative ABC transport system permease protein
LTAISSHPSPGDEWAEEDGMGVWGSAWASARIAVRALRVNKLRSALTMLGIVIGVGAVITMVAVGAGAQARVAEQIQSLGSNMLIVLSGSVLADGVRMGSGSQLTITEDDAWAIQRDIPAVAAAAPTSRGGAQVVYGNLNWATGIQGVTLEFFTAREWDVADGRLFSQEEIDGAGKVALLGQTVSGNLFGDGEPLGQVIRIKNVPFTVIGLLERKGQTTFGQDQDDTVLIPLSTAKKKVLGASQANARSVGSIAVKVREARAMPEAEQEIRGLLRQRHRLQPFQDDDFNIRNLTEVLQSQEASSRVLTLLLAAIASVSLLVGGIGIMNIMLVSVTERTREIGLRMAVGARGRDILLQFLVEAVTLSLIGGVVGITTGLAGSYAIAYFARWRTLVSPEAVVVAFGFAAAVGVFFGFYPARKAAALNPIEALRYE